MFGEVTALPAKGLWRFTRKVVVLGGGPGGYAAAFLAADLGLEITIVEADPRLGGTCLLRGCIPSKALLHVAKVISEAAEMADWGVEFPKPKISIDKMRARKEQVIDTLSGGLAQLAKRRNVRVINARGIFVDSQTLQLEGGDKSTYDSERLTFDHCILATGSRAGDAEDVQDRLAARDGLDRRAGAGRRARVAAGDRRRLHRPGNGHRLRRAGLEGHGRRTARRPACPAPIATW